MNLQNPIILCVDDEEANLKLLEHILVPRGYVMVRAASGEDALLKIKSQSIDLVLLDILMPGLDGFEVCRRIKEHPKFRSIPVIMITSLTSKQDRVRGIEVGVDDFLSKPFDQTEALARIHSLLKVKGLNDDRECAGAELQKSHDVLDCQVRERTQELEQANNKLRVDSFPRARAARILQLRNRAVESLIQGLCITDSAQPDNPIVNVNDSFLRITGYAREDVLGRNCRFLQGPKTAPESIERIRTALRDGTSCRVELLNYRKDGTSFWNSLSISPIRDGAGRVTHFAGVLTDSPSVGANGEMHAMQQTIYPTALSEG